MVFVETIYCFSQEAFISHADEQLPAFLLLCLKELGCFKLLTVKKHVFQGI